MLLLRKLKKHICTRLKTQVYCSSDFCPSPGGDWGVFYFDKIIRWGNTYDLSSIFIVKFILLKSLVGPLSYTLTPSASPPPACIYLRHFLYILSTLRPPFYGNVLSPDFVGLPCRLFGNANL